MGVDIFRCPGAAVTEMLGDHFPWDAHIDHQGSVGMSEVVDMDVGEIVSFQMLLELQVDVILVHVLPKLPREHSPTVN